MLSLMIFPSGWIKSGIWVPDLDTIMRLRLAGGHHCFHFAVSKSGTEERSGADGMEGGGTEAPFWSRRKMIARYSWPHSAAAAAELTSEAKRRRRDERGGRGQWRGAAANELGARWRLEFGNKYFVRFCEQEWWKIVMLVCVCIQCLTCKVAWLL